RRERSCSASAAAEAAAAPGGVPGATAAGGAAGATVCVAACTAAPTAGAAPAARGMVGAERPAPLEGNSNATCTGRENQSLARLSTWWEKFLRTQSSLKRLGAETRSTPWSSSKARGTRGRIHALICWGGSSCSSFWTQACQKSFIVGHFCKPRFYPVGALVIHRPDDHIHEDCPQVFDETVEI